MIISIHIPKCSGTLFRMILENHFKSQFWANYDLPATGLTLKDIPKNINCIHGHFSAKTFRELFPNAKVITWVRHPVQRLISQYYHHQRYPDKSGHLGDKILKERLTLEDFFLLPELSNVLHKVLEPVNISDFDFVGVSEFFVPSLQIFSNQFGFGHVPENTRVNCNPNKIESEYQLDKRLLDLAAEINSLDMEIYQNALLRLKSELLQKENKVNRAPISTFD